MKRKLWVIPLIIILLTVIFWFTNQFIYPVIPPNIGNQIIIVVGILVAIVSFLANIATTLDYFEKITSKHSLSTDNKKIVELPFTQSELDIYNKLCVINRSDFESIVYKLGIGYSKLPDYDVSQSIRAEMLINLAHNNTTTVESISKTIHEIEQENRFAFLFWESFGATFSILFKGLYNQLVMWRVIQQPAETQIIHEYLKYFEKEMARRNGGELVYVPQYVGAVTDSATVTGDFTVEISSNQFVQRVRQVLRLLSGISYGGDNASAQLASVNRPSRVVKDAVRILLNSKEPLILLGDPGSGKSMTIREVGRQIANKNYGVRYPKVVIYVPLSMYVSKDVDGYPGKVLDFIYQSIPLSHRKVRDLLPVLIAERRLIVLFDGIDEMEHSQYGNRIRRLSDFAGSHSDEIKTLFACRINDFIPEFEHRQMVLLPFEKRQIIEFVGKNISFPINLEGKSCGRRDFLKLLMQKNETGEIANNPLMLFLICHYVKWENKWPHGRADLFEKYLATVYSNYAKKEKLPLNKNHKESIVFGLSFLAYSISSTFNGTYGEVSELYEKLGSELAKEIIAIGQKCGILLPIPENPDGARFSHHRLQEFLTAHYIVKSDVQIRWDKLIDIPRWQETLLNIASLEPSSKALRALQESLSESLTSIVAPVDKLELKFENRAVDRLVLASNVIRELGNKNKSLPENFEYALEILLKKLAKHGRPTTQVKVLWAWRNLVNLPVEYLRPQLESEISWVREQAILVAGALSSEGARTGGNIPFEIAIDVGKGEFIKRLHVYIKLVSQTGNWNWLLPISWATLCSIIYTFSGVFTAIFIVFFYLMKYPLITISPLYFSLVVFVMLILAEFIVDRYRVNALQSFLLSALMLCSVIAVLSRLQSAAQTMSLYLFALLDLVIPMAGIYLLLFTVNHLVFWLSYNAYVLPISAIYRTSFDINSSNDLASESGVNKFYKNANSSGQIWFWGVIGIFQLTYPFYPFLSLDQSFLPYVEFALIGLGLVILLLLLVFALVLLVGAIKLLIKFFVSSNKKEIITDGMHGWWGWRGGCSYYIIGLIAMMVFSIGVVQRVTFWIILGLIVSGVFIAAGIYFSRKFTQALPIVRKEKSSSEWEETVRRSDPQIQYVYLTGIRRQDLSLSTKEFLNILIQIEDNIKEDPAASAYWKLRHEVEETIRRESIDSLIVEDDASKSEGKLLN